MNAQHSLLEPSAALARPHRERLETMVVSQLLALAPPATPQLSEAIGQAQLLGSSTMPLYPGVYALYHRLASQDEIESSAAWVALMDEASGYSQRRPLSLAPAVADVTGGYAADSVRRALSQAPADIDRAVVTSHLRPWSPAQADTLDQACAVIREVWPEAAAEIESTIAEVWLLGGVGLIGFTDFSAHGAIFLSDSLFDPADGVPGVVRLAEHTLHESAHTVCNAAVTAQPLIRRPDEGGITLAPTPLRADQRPLAGLAQQLVVLVRCAEFYRRALGTGFDDEALDRRAGALTNDAATAAETLLKFGRHLTEAGVRLAEEARERLRVLS